MASYDFLNLVFSQQGVITVDQFIQVYDYSPTLLSIMYDEDREYQYEFWFSDKIEPIFCNI